jgi:hypothetical protein
VGGVAGAATYQEAKAARGLQQFRDNISTILTEEYGQQKHREKSSKGESTAA